MSSGISQIEYWRQTDKPTAPGANNASTNKNTSEGGPGSTYLSYDVFMGLSILGGALALDHLYLRSPLTFLAKIIVNILTLGSWWLYDASQAIFNKDIVKVFGLGVPGLGPKGIAAGVLASDVPDKKHMSFFIYGLAVIFGGLFGLDSFIVGDKQAGFIRIICLITGILAPIAIFWWLYNLIMFLFKPKSVVNTYWDFFGAPQPYEQTLTIKEKLASKFPFLERIFGPLISVKNATVATATAVEKGAEDFAEAVTQDPSTLLTKPGEIVGSIISAPLDIFGSKVTNISNRITSQLQPAINAAVIPAKAALEPILEAARPFKNTINSGIGVAQTGLETVQDALVLGKTALNTGAEIAGRTLNVVGQTADAATKALTLAPAAAAITTGFTPGAAQAALSKLEQQGGVIVSTASSNVLAYSLLGTFGVIAVSGLILTYRRFRQNEQQSKRKRADDDSPPEPGVL